MGTAVRELGAGGLRDHLIHTAIPLAAAAGVGVRYQIAGGVTLGLVISVALLPVWLPELVRYRGARLLFGLGLVALVAGVVLTLADGTRETSTALLAQEGFRFAALLGIIGTLVWVRAQTSALAAAGAFGVGMLASVFLVGGNTANLWKYSLSLPVVVIGLAWAGAQGRRSVQIAVLASLSVISLAADARSLTSTLILTGALVLWQARPAADRQGKPRPWATIATLALIAFAAFQIMQALILEGALGEAARERSRAQLDASGSILVGGRPEIGAAAALITHRPWGFGSGTLLTSTDVWIAKIGMSALNYNPNNGYVESYMFGGRIEVHSVIGDMWLRFGPVGAVFAVVAVGLCVYSLASLVSARTADALVIYVVLLAGWNLLFSPLETSYRPLGLAIAITLLPVGQRAAEPLRSSWRTGPGTLAGARHATVSRS